MIIILFVPDLKPRTKQEQTTTQIKTRYFKAKSPICLDAATVTNLSGVELADDKMLLLTRGLTFVPLPGISICPKFKRTLTIFPDDHISKITSRSNENGGHTDVSAIHEKKLSPFIEWDSSWA